MSQLHVLTTHSYILVTLFPFLNDFHRAIPEVLRKMISFRYNKEKNEITSKGLFLVGSVMNSCWNLPGNRQRNKKIKENTYGLYLFFAMSQTCHIHVSSYNFPLDTFSNHATPQQGFNLCIRRLTL